MPRRIVLCLGCLFLLASCLPASLARDARRGRDVTLRLSIPDHGRAVAHRSVGRMVDAATARVDVTVSAADIATMSRSFSVQPGASAVECTVEDVPEGAARRFDVTARDGSGEALTAGSAMADVGRETTVVSLNLLPVAPVEVTGPLAAGETVNVSGSVGTGRTAWFRVTWAASAACTVRLTAEQDVDLLLFRSDGALWIGDAWGIEAPADESVAVDGVAGEACYLGVYGRGESASPLVFTLALSRAAEPPVRPTQLTGTVTLDLSAGGSLADATGKAFAVSLLDASLAVLATGSNATGLWGSAMSESYSIGIASVPDGTYYLAAAIGAGEYTGWYHSSGALQIDRSDAELASPNATLPPYEHDLAVGYAGAPPPESPFTAEMVEDICAGGASSNPGSLCVYNGQLYFLATDETHGAGLYRYDGVNPTQRVTALDTAGGQGPNGMTVYDGKMYFRATSSGNGVELWRYDSVTDAAQRLSNINPGTGDSNPDNFTVYQGKLYFSATNVATFIPYNVNFELYSCDSAGTVTLAKEINPTGSADPTSFALYDDGLGSGELLCFAATNGDGGLEIWSYDGANAVQRTDVNASGDSYPTLLTVFSGKLYFQAYHGTGFGLYSFDGLETKKISDIPPGDMTVFGSDLYMTAADAEHGQELFTLEGAALSLAADILPGSWSSQPQYLTVFGAWLLFSANDATGMEVQNREPWAWNGASAVRAAEVHPSTSAGSNPSGFTEYNGRLYFAADDGTHGTELWVLYER